MEIIKRVVSVRIKGTWRSIKEFFLGYDFGNLCDTVNDSGEESNLENSTAGKTVEKVGQTNVPKVEKRPDETLDPQTINCKLDACKKLLNLGLYDRAKGIFLSLYGSLSGEDQKENWKNKGIDINKVNEIRDKLKISEYDLNKVAIAEINEKTDKIIKEGKYEKETAELEKEGKEKKEILSRLLKKEGFHNLANGISDHEPPSIEAFAKNIEKIKADWLHHPYKAYCAKKVEHLLAKHNYSSSIPSQDSDAENLIKSFESDVAVRYDMLKKEALTILASISLVSVPVGATLLSPEREQHPPANQNPDYVSLTSDDVLNMPCEKVPAYIQQIENSSVPHWNLNSSQLKNLGVEVDGNVSGVMIDTPEAGGVVVVFKDGNVIERFKVSDDQINKYPGGTKSPEIGTYNWTSGPGQDRMHFTEYAQAMLDLGYSPGEVAKWLNDIGCKVKKERV